MNEKSIATMYDAIPVVSELNKVPGFNPLKFLRKTQDGPKLDLKYKKLWFRLKYPAGRTKLTALRITEQLAIIEAKVYFDKNNQTPNGNVVAQARAQDVPGGLYIEAAQHNALEQALEDAGFGIQFIPATANNTAENVSVSMPGKEAGANAAADKTMEIKSASPQVMESVPAMEPIPVTEIAEETLPSVNEAPNTRTAAPIFDEQVSSPAEVTQVTAEIPVETAELQEESRETPEAAVVYTKDMPVDEICSCMTVDEAENVLVPIGTCKGWTLSQVADRRPASLKWYLNGYNGDDNILRAGAKLMLEMVSTMEKAG